MTAWIWVLVSACVLATVITVSGCIVSGKISREEEQKGKEM